MTEAAQLLTRSQVCQLPIRERQRHVEKLRVFYPAWNTIYRKIERCHHMNEISAEPQGLLIVGRPRAGKTTIVSGTLSPTAYSRGRWRL